MSAELSKPMLRELRSFHKDREPTDPVDWQNVPDSLWFVPRASRPDCGQPERIQADGSRPCGARCCRACRQQAGREVVTLPITKEIKALREAHDTARSKLAEHDRLIRDYRSKREDEFEKLLSEEIEAKFGAKRAELTAASNAAGRAHEEAKDRHAKSGEEGMMPVGTKLVEWRMPRSFYTVPYVLTGRVAVFEIVSSNSPPFRENLRWSKPNVGDQILRILKKDGRTPSVDFVTMTGGEFWGWHPEGVDPNKKKGK